MRSSLVITLSLLSIQNVIAVENPGPLVETNVGWIQGLRATDGDYSMYMGIPYGRVNETNPFGNPLPHSGFETIYSAFDDLTVCPHRPATGMNASSLDCLRLNIHVPNSASPQNLLPVMVWIHGGSFTTGSGSRQEYGPKFLVRHDVIFVSLNYRLGPYGFMCLNIPEVSGNQGLKDQALALRWIRDNIEAFGGDADKVTLFGESAGGMSTGFHLLSSEETLYRNVIIISGSTLRGKILMQDANPSAPMRIAQQLGFETDDVYEALRFLSLIEPITLLEANQRAGLQYRPCVEQYFENADNFLLDYPVNLEVPKVKGMPVLIGFSSQERLMSYSRDDPAVFENANPFSNQLATLFDFEDEKFIEMVNIARQFYIGDEPISILERLGLINFDSDVVFNYPTERSIQRYIQDGVGNLFYYVFSYIGRRNWTRYTQNIQIGGAAHSDILGYIFDMARLADTPTPDDQLVIDRLTTMWTNFAKYNDPTPTTSVLLPVKWEPITQASPYHYLDIDWRLSLHKKPYNKRMAFWDLFYEGNGQFERGFRET